MGKAGDPLQKGSLTGSLGFCIGYFVMLFPVLFFFPQLQCFVVTVVVALKINIKCYISLILNLLFVCACVWGRINSPFKYFGHV